MTMVKANGNGNGTSRGNGNSVGNGEGGGEDNGNGGDGNGDSNVDGDSDEDVNSDNDGDDNGNDYGNSDGNGDGNGSISVLVVVGTDQMSLLLLDGYSCDWWLGVVGAEPTLLSSARIQRCCCWRGGNIVVIVGGWHHILCQALAYCCCRCRADSVRAANNGLALLRNCFRHQGAHTFTCSSNACCKPPRYVPYKCTYVPYNDTFGASDQRSDARCVKWHPADVNSEVAVTLLRGEVTTSAQHEVLYKQRYCQRNQCNDIRSYG
jgi:hypothetical protein